MNEWATIAVSVLGSIGGAYYGVRMAITRLQTQMENVLQEIISLRESRHLHAGMIQEHEGRLSALERSHSRGR